jgi:Peptidase family S41
MERGTTRKTLWIGTLAALGIMAGIVLAVGRGPEPQNPFAHSDPEKSDPRTAVRVADLIRDIDYYVGLVDGVQADPYRQVPKQSFLLKARELRDRLRNLPTETLPLIDAYYGLQELAAFLQDEHTTIDFQPAWLQAFPNHFPLALRILEGKTFVMEDYSDAGIPRTAELVSVAGRPVADMLAETQKLINVTLPHYKRQVAETMFGTWLQTYFKASPPWEVVYRFDGKEKTVTVAGLPEAEYAKKARRDDRYSETTFDVDGETIPLLEIPRFWYRDRAAYEKFINDFFVRHKDKNYLVIDLRRNPGGDGRWGFFVLDYLRESPYITMKRFAFRISREFATLNVYERNLTYHKKGIPRLLWWVPFFRTLHKSPWMDRVYQAKVGEYAEERETYRTPDPGKVRFRGRAFLLVSHATNSAAVVFAAIFKDNKLGIIVGQETGGRETFTSDSISIQMPKTPLVASVPVAILALPGGNPDRGVIPDVQVEYSLADRLGQKDLDLERVKELIKIDLGAKTASSLQPARAK